MIRATSIVMLLAALLAACDRAPAPSPEASSTSETIGPSIYPLATPLRDQDGHVIALDTFRGHPVIVSMFYASCPSACPLTISRIQAIERELTPAEQADLRVLLVSFDREHDTPAVLREAADSHHVDERWKLTSASTDDARALAAALGVTYTKRPEGGFSHNSVLMLLDRDGRTVARVEGATTDTSAIVHALSARDRS